MYSLPITTYTDYWRATKTWTSYIGGLAVFAVGTHYSPLDIPKNPQPMQLPIQQTIQSLNDKKIDLEIASASPKWTEIKGTVRQSELVQLKLNKPGSEASSWRVLGQNALKPSTISGEIFSQPEPDLSGGNGAELNQVIIGHSVIGRGVFNLRPVSRSTADQAAANSDEFKQDLRDQLISTSETLVEDKEIPFKTEYIETDKIPPGTSQIKKKGEPGVFRQVIKIFEVGGQPVDQQIQASFELKSPATEMILRNTKPVVKKRVTIPQNNPTGRSAPDFDKATIIKTLTVEATAYTFTGNKTATGIEPREGLIAVDPKVVALGSKLYIEGYGYAVAADTGGAINGNRIDVFFSTLRQCINWGRRPVKIYILNS